MKKMNNTFAGWLWLCFGFIGMMIGAGIIYSGQHPFPVSSMESFFGLDTLHH